MNYRKSLVATIVLLLAGCDSIDTSQQTSELAAEFDSNIANLAKTPSSSGVVIRWQNDVALFAYFNPDEQIVSTHATVDVLDWACGGEHKVFEPLSITSVVTPRGPTVSRTDSELQVRVYAPSTLTLADLFTDPCGALEAQPLMAEGFLRQTYNDNDVSGFGGRSNAFTVRTNGSIDMVGGGEATYRMFRHWQISRDGDFRTIKSVGPELTSVR